MSSHEGGVLVPSSEGRRGPKHPATKSILFPATSTAQTSYVVVKTRDLNVCRAETHACGCPSEISPALDLPNLKEGWRYPTAGVGLDWSVTTTVSDSASDSSCGVLDGKDFLKSPHM